MRDRHLALVISLLGLFACGRDEAFVGLGHTYAEIEARSDTFIIHERFPFRWRIEEARVHLDLGGVWFTFEDARGDGLANHPNPRQIRAEVASWMEAHVFEINLYTEEQGGLEDVRIAATIVEFMDAMREAGWEPKDTLPTSAAEIRSILAVPPHFIEWGFRCPQGPEGPRPATCPPVGARLDSGSGKWPREPWSSIFVSWEAEDDPIDDSRRRGVGVAVRMWSGELTNAPLKWPDIKFQ